ncbi:hypothetical protein CW304_08365 [Bacillus sp. UFRGS-B20]|nr:hypothetical protein CW304_08365 [Bacillus sp. UFRGS-B20]
MACWLYAIINATNGHCLQLTLDLLFSRKPASEYPFFRVTRLFSHAHSFPPIQNLMPSSVNHQ